MAIVPISETLFLSQTLARVAPTDLRLRSVRDDTAVVLEPTEANHQLVEPPSSAKAHRAGATRLQAWAVMHGRELLQQHNLSAETLH